MRHLITVAALSACLSASLPANSQPTAAANGASAPLTAQQSKMGACNNQAGDKKGDERKAFMKSCLSAKSSMTQQEKMKACNADPTAKSTKGDERKAFMKECLSK